MTAWMDESKEKIKTFETDFREDEADLEKIKLNVYDIFLKMFNLSLKKTKDNEAFKTMYLKFHTTIPKNWQANLKKARENDSIDEYIETIKIETAKRIETMFQNVWDNYEQS